MTAVVPGRANNQFNLLSQARRQPGSTFKTFVLAAAVERGLDPDSTYYVSAPFTYKPDDERELRRRHLVVREDLRLELQRLDVGRAGDAPLGQLRLRPADARRRAGAGRRRWPAASACGRRSTSAAQYVPAMGLGSIAVSPLDMASAYATLAAGGIYSEPTAIRKVVLRRQAGRPVGDRAPPRRA